MICKITNFFANFFYRKKIVKFVKFQEWKKLVKFEFSIYEVYCDKTSKARITGFQHGKLVWEIRKDHLDRGWVVSSFDFALYLGIRKWCEIELRSQLVTNRKWYNGLLIGQLLNNLSDLERQFTALTSMLCYVHCDETAEARIKCCLSVVISSSLCNTSRLLRQNGRFSLNSRQMPQPLAWWVWWQNSKSVLLIS